MKKPRKVIKLTKKQQLDRAAKELDAREPERVSDLQKTKFYKAIQDTYNANAFGYGISGTLTRFDPSKEENQKKIKSNFNYAKRNAGNFGLTLATSGIMFPFKGFLPSTTRRATVGYLKDLIPYKIGEGAEAMVFKNSPTTVAKVTSMGSGEMLAKNGVPNSVPLKFVGYVRDGSRRFLAFLQKKVRVLNKETFPKYVNKLDKAMRKKGFRRVNDPYIQYRAYIDGNIVVDDVAPGNVGITFFGNPKLIDYNKWTIPEWLEQGFKLKKGGKL